VDGSTSSACTFNAAGAEGIEQRGAPAAGASHQAAAQLQAPGLPHYAQAAPQAVQFTQEHSEGARENVHSDMEALAATLMPAPPTQPEHKYIGVRKNRGGKFSARIKIGGSNKCGALPL
jgi:hypothetical protein